MQALFNAVSHRIVVEYADSIALHILAGLPGKLEDLVGTVNDRIIVEYADSVRISKLACPSVETTIYLPIVRRGR